MKKIVFSFFISGFFLLNAHAQVPENINCAVYITAVGCPYCLTADTYIFNEILSGNPDLLLIQFEVFEQPQNFGISTLYHERYNTGVGLPLFVLNEERYFVGRNILKDEFLKEIGQASKMCLLPDGPVNIDGLDLEAIGYTPFLWRDNRVAFPFDMSGGHNLILDALFVDDLAAYLEEHEFEPTVPNGIPITNSYIEFNNAVKLDGWVLQWNDDKPNIFFPEDIEIREENETDLTMYEPIDPVDVIIIDKRQMNQDLRNSRIELIKQRVIILLSGFAIFVFIFFLVLPHRKK